MTVLLTGASGYIGSRFAQAVIDQGRRVVAVSRPGRTQATRARVGRPIDVIEDPGETSDLARLLGPYDVSATVHLAARFDKPERNPEALITANVAFAARVAEAVNRVAPGSIFVNAATIWQHYGPDHDAPLSYYAATKSAFEAILAFYASTGELDTRTLIIPDTYGPDDPRTKIVTLLIDAAQGGGPLKATSGRGVLDLVHVDDVVAAIEHTIGRSLGTGRWAVTSDRALTVRELADVIAQVSGREVPVSWGVLPDRPRQFLEAPSTASRLPGWSPSISLTQGVAQLLDRADHIDARGEEECHRG